MKTRKKVVHKIVSVVIRSYEILFSIFMILVGDGSFKKCTKSFVNLAITFESLDQTFSKLGV